jgi:UDP-glucuronate 4-epimerase
MAHTPTVLITGFAGFIGTNLVHELSPLFRVVGVDNFGVEAYAKHYAQRLSSLGAALPQSDLPFAGEVYAANNYYKADVCDADAVVKIVAKEKPEVIIHLAALTGVRQSFDQPAAYIAANITGTVNVFEAAKQFGVKHLLYASSSSVYGKNEQVELLENSLSHSPLSVYGATKLADELMAHTYYNAFGLSSTGFRFFTVYGPWNRPDMAAYLFLDKMKNQQPIELFNDGAMHRDFTYVGDVVTALRLYVEASLQGKIKVEGAEVYNIGGGTEVALREFVTLLENASGYKAIVQPAAHQTGDMTATRANADRLEQLLHYKPNTPLEIGLPKLVAWFEQYHS